MKDGHVYFHSPCFDGICSAVLVSDFLGARRGWSSPRLHAVNYDSRDAWLELPLHQPCAVVDFLYHPRAEFWADHHPTTFLNDHVESEFERRASESLVYDREAASCAGLLWRHLREAFGYENQRYGELVGWAEKTDAARYDSVHEAIEASAPALRISAGLAYGDQDNYSAKLVLALSSASVSEVADLPDVRDRYNRYRADTSAGLERFVARDDLEDVLQEGGIVLEDDGIAVFKVDAREGVVPRYSPYYFFPRARYSIGIMCLKRGCKITAMRNPWLDFESVQLGRIFAEKGGGGHQRVGSVYLKDEANGSAERILIELLQATRSGIAAQRDPAETCQE